VLWNGNGVGKKLSNENLKVTIPHAEYGIFILFEQHDNKWCQMYV
jgi:hypothetical protein